MGHKKKVRSLGQFQDRTRFQASRRKNNTD